MSRRKCAAKVATQGGWHLRDCKVAAKIERNGKWYCGRHDPVARARKSDARSKKWSAVWDAQRDLEAAKKAIFKRAGEHPDFAGLIKALDTALERLNNAENT